MTYHYISTSIFHDNIMIRSRFGRSSTIAMAGCRVGEKIFGCLKTGKYLTLSFDTMCPDHACSICMSDAFPSAQEIYS